MFRYSDDEYEYRHVQLPKNMLKAIPQEYMDPQKGTLKLLWEDEWRGLGITQSLGWEHYEVHEPEPHILLFKYDVFWSPALTTLLTLGVLDGPRTFSLQRSRPAKGRGLARLWQQSNGVPSTTACPCA